MARSIPDASGLKKLHMLCRCTHRHAHTELVLSGTRPVGQSALSFNPHPCKGCSHSTDAALEANGSGIHPSKELCIWDLLGTRSKPLPSPLASVQKPRVRSLPVAQGVCRDLGGSNLHQSFISSDGKESICHSYDCLWT